MNVLKFDFWDHQSSKHPQEWTKSGLRSKIWVFLKMVISRCGASSARFYPGALIYNEEIFRCECNVARANVTKASSGNIE